MTRINLIPPEQLSRQHLVAEYRELPRIFTLARKARERGEKPGDARNPRQYVLGTGHCRFFYNKIGWLCERFRAIIAEMQSRGYKTSFIDYDVSDFPDEWKEDYHPTTNEIAINVQRIEERTR